MIPAPVRAHYQKRLCLLGPESVGKTRLATDLAARFNTRVMPEYGRDYDVHYKQRRHAGHAWNTEWRADDLITLARTHAAMRDAMRAEAGPLLIEDTDAVQTAVWAAHLIGEVPPALAAIEAATLADHYLLLSPDVDWTDDGVRYAGAEKIRAFFFTEAERRLKMTGASYDIIDGADWDTRRARAIDIVRRRFGPMA
jgi:NadR type nicotinamide-nucleotide adenylyltransferase